MKSVSDTLIDTQTVTDIDEVETFITSDLALQINKVVITVLSTAPYRRVRVGRMYYRTSDFFLDFTTITERTQVVTKIDQLKSVSVSQYSYIVAEEAITLYHEQTQEETLHVEFAQPAQDVSISVEGGEVISSEIYGMAVDMVLSAGMKTVTISGVPLTESTVVINTPVNASGEVDVEENPLITNEAMRLALTEHVIKYATVSDAKYTMTIEMKWVYGTDTTYKSVVFDAPEAFYTHENDTALAIGTYHFTLATAYSSWAAGDYQFTTAKTHPKPRIYYLDTEQLADGVTYEQEKEFIKVYVKRLREWGVECIGQYTGDYRWRTQYRDLEPIFDTLWIANWGKDNGSYEGQTIKSAAYTDKIALHQFTSNGYTKVAGAPGIDHRVDLNRLTGVKPLSWFTGRTYEDEPAPVPDLGYTKYVVKDKDTLWGIAKKLLGNGNKYKAIMTANGMTSTVIRKGDVLNIPKA